MDCELCNARKVIESMQAEARDSSHSHRDEVTSMKRDLAKKDRDLNSMTKEIQALGLQRNVVIFVAMFVVPVLVSFLCYTNQKSNVEPVREIPIQPMQIEGKTVSC